MRAVTAAALVAVLVIAQVAAASDAKKRAVSKEDDTGKGRIDDGHDLVLEKLIVLNRHGHRAPNAPFWTLCPTEIGNAKKFGTGPEDLTSVGFEEEYKCGVYTRELYPDVVGKDYNRSNHFVQATGEPRTLQSAMAITNGAFPVTKKSPSGVLPHHPNLVPVYSANQNREYFLNDIPCKQQTAEAVSAFLAGDGQRIYDENRKLLEHVMTICGTTKEAREAVSMDALVKLIVDGVIFEHDFGMTPLRGKLTDKQFMQLRNVSNAFLFGKLYGTDEQRTYTAGEFPHFLVKGFDFLAGREVSNAWNDNQLQAIQTPLNIFVVHREEIYGMAFFFDWRYTARDMAPGEVPAGTAFIFEYLLEKSSGTRYLRVKMWNPREGEVVVEMDRRFCKHRHMCSEEELKAQYSQRVARTGKWDRICQFPRPDRWFTPQ